MKRVTTALALIVVALYLIWLAPSHVFTAAAILVGSLCYWEFSGIVVAQGIGRPALTGAALGFALILVPQYGFYFAVFLLLTHFALLLRKRDLAGILPEAACTLTGAFYAYAPWSFAVSLRQASPHLLFFSLAMNWVGDSAAFYAGRSFGKHKLAPAISPGKSWEGAVASAVAAVLFGLVYLGKVLPGLSLWTITALALLGNIAGQIGDLAESSMKRGAGLKDSGKLLPGHGGVLDRLDSSMFALPTIYLFYRLALR
jgi:phosphatidate cytidylyltransferase